MSKSLKIVKKTLIGLITTSILTWSIWVTNQIFAVENEVSNVRLYSVTIKESLQEIKDSIKEVKMSVDKLRDNIIDLYKEKEKGK